MNVTWHQPTFTPPRLTAHGPANGRPQSRAPRELDLLNLASSEHLAHLPLSVF